MASESNNKKKFNPFAKVFDVSGTKDVAKTPQSNLGLSVGKDGLVHLEDRRQQIQDVMDHAQETRDEQAREDNEFTIPGVEQPQATGLTDGGEVEVQEADTSLLPRKTVEEVGQERDAQMGIEPTDATKVETPVIPQADAIEKEPTDVDKLAIDLEQKKLSEEDSKLADSVADKALETAQRQADQWAEEHAAEKLGTAGTDLSVLTSWNRQYYKQLTPENVDEIAKNVMTDPDLIAQIMGGAKQQGLSEEGYANYMLIPKIQERIYQKLVEKHAPKSTLEYVASGVFNSTLGKLYEMAMYPTAERNLRAAGRQLAAEQQGTLAQIANQGVGFVADIPVFGIYGGAARAAVGTMGRLGMDMAGTAARALSEGLNFGMYEGTTSLVDDAYRNGTLTWEDAEKALAAAAKGTITGALMGVMGSQLDKMAKAYINEGHEFGREILGINKVNATQWSANMIGRTSLMALSDVAGQSMTDPNFTFENVDWTEALKNAMMMNLMMEGDRVIRGGIKKVTGAEKVNFTEDELQAMRNSGIPVRTSGQVEQYMRMNWNEKIPQLIGNKQLPWSLKNKMIKAVTGRDGLTQQDSTSGKLGRTLEGKWTADEYTYGDVLNNRTLFNTREEAEAYLASREETLQQNRQAAITAIDESRANSKALYEGAQVAAKEHKMKLKDIMDLYHQHLLKKPLSEEQEKIVQEMKDYAATYKEYADRPGLEVEAAVEKAHGKPDGWMAEILGKKRGELDAEQRQALDEYLDELEHRLNGKKAGRTALSEKPRTDLMTDEEESQWQQEGQQLYQTGSLDQKRQQNIRTNVARQRLVSKLGEEFMDQLDEQGLEMLNDYPMTGNEIQMVKDYWKQKTITDSMVDSLDEAHKVEFDIAQERVKTMSPMADQDGNNSVTILTDGRGNTYVVRKQDGDQLMVTDVLTDDQGNIRWDSYDPDNSHAMKWNARMEMRQLLADDVIRQMVPEYDQENELIMGDLKPAAGMTIERGDGKKLTLQGQDQEGNWIATDGKEQLTLTDDEARQAINDQEVSQVETEHSEEYAQVSQDIHEARKKYDTNVEKPEDKISRNWTGDNTFTYENGKEYTASTGETIGHMMSMAGGDTGLVLRTVRNKSRQILAQMDEIRKQLNGSDLKTEMENRNKLHDLQKMLESWDEVEFSLSGRDPKYGRAPEGTRQLAEERPMVERFAKALGVDLLITDTSEDFLDVFNKMVDEHNENLMPGEKRWNHLSGLTEAENTNGANMGGRLLLNGTTSRGIEFAFGHESGHKLKAKSPALYDKMKKAILEELGEEYVQEQLKHKKGIGVYKDSTDDEITDEIANDGIGTVMANPERLKSLMQKLGILPADERKSAIQELWDTAKTWMKDRNQESWDNLLNQARLTGGKEYQAIKQRMQNWIGFQDRLAESEKILASEMDKIEEEIAQAYKGVVKPVTESQGTGAGDGVGTPVGDETVTGTGEPEYSVDASQAMERGEQQRWRDLKPGVLNGDNIGMFMWGLSKNYPGTSKPITLGALLHETDGKQVVDQEKLDLELEHIRENLMPMRNELMDLRFSPVTSEAAKRVIDSKIYDIDYASNFYTNLDNGTLTPADLKNVDMPRFSQEKDKKQPIFYSNAERAVEGIKQEKAQPDQWLAMIQKLGGMKAGEDKWMRLSDWLKQKKGSVTKDELLKYIQENSIQVKDVRYSDEVESHDWTLPYEREYQELIDINEGDEWRAFRQMVEKYGEDFEDVFESDGQYLFARTNEDSREYYAPEKAEKFMGDRYVDSTRVRYRTRGLRNNREIALVVPTIEPYKANDLVHFGDAGDGRAVAWARFGDTTDADGKKVLVIDEIQSKRHQEGRERGYGKKPVHPYVKGEYKPGDAWGDTADIYDDYGNKIGIMHRQDGEYWAELGNTWTSSQSSEAEVLERIPRILGGIPDAPFDKNWQELAMKRMLRLAAEEGYDKLAWTDGLTQAERYAIGGVVDDIYYAGTFDGVRNIDINLKNGHIYHLGVDNDGHIVTEYNGDGNELSEADRSFTNKNLSEVIGKNAAEQVMNLDAETTIQGKDLVVGGEGMKGFYDQMLPRFMDKYGKKWGVKTRMEHLDGLNDGASGYQVNGGLDMHVIDVTPEMKASVMEGQPMFSQERGKSEGISENKSENPWLNEDKLLTLRSKERYLRKEVQEASRKAHENFARPELAYLSDASREGVKFTYDELAAIPEIRKAQEQYKARNNGRLEISEDELRQHVSHLLDKDHGSYSGHDTFHGEVANERQAYIVIGRPAGGKSSVYANPLSQKHKARIIDSDTVKPWLKGFDGGDGAGYVHPASDAVSMAALRVAASRGENVVIPRIGGDTILELAYALDKFGYDVQLYYNDVPAESSYTRSMARYAETGRFLDLDYLHSIGPRPRNTFAVANGTKYDIIRHLAEVEIAKNKENGTNNHTYQDILKSIEDERRTTLSGNEEHAGINGQHGSVIPRDQRRGLNTPDEGARSGEEMANGSEYDQPLFKYLEWADNDVPYKTPYKVVWTSESKEPLPIEKPEFSQEADTRGEKFKRFFGDWERYPGEASKVVDESGQPLILSHATPYYGFTVFNTHKNKWGETTMGSHFGSEEAAKDRLEMMGSKADTTEKGTYHVYLNIRNPWECNDWFDQNDSYVMADLAHLALMHKGNKKVQEYWKFIKNLEPWSKEYTDEQLDEATFLYDNRHTLESYDEDDLGTLYSYVKAMVRAAGHDGIKYWNDVEGNGYSWVAFEPNQIKSAETEGEMANNGEFNPEEMDIRYSHEKDSKTLERLESEETIPVYRAMQVIDGKLYPPMSAMVNGKLREPIQLGVWEKADENPELADENGNFKLTKGGKHTPVPARYNPYIHTSPIPLNDQFAEAQNRPNLVTVEVLVPKSELTSGYKAEKAKDPVGLLPWPAGIVQKQITGTRDLILSRWDKPVRIVPDSEVAQTIKDMFGQKLVTMPSNVVTPSLREELEKLGIPFVETNTRGQILFGENAGKTYGSVYGKKAQDRATKLRGTGTDQTNDINVAEIKPKQGENFLDYAQRVATEEWNRNNYAHVDDQQGTVDIKFSQETYNKRGRAMLHDQLDKAVERGYMHPKEADEISRNMENIYDIVSDMKELKDAEGNPLFQAFADVQSMTPKVDVFGNVYLSVVKGNAEYPMNIDFSKSCVKREAMNAVLDALLLDPRFDINKMTNEDYLNVKEICKKNGLEIPCYGCFVENGRARTVQFAKKAAEEWNKLVNMATGGKATPFDLDAESQDAGKVVNVEKFRKQYKELAELNGKKGKPKLWYLNIGSWMVLHPELLHTLDASALISPTNYEKLMRNLPEVNKYIKEMDAQGTPNMIIPDAIYDSDVLALDEKGTGWGIDQAFEIGGVRLQSASDFKPKLFFDYCQLLADLASKKLPSHTYTKVPSYVRLYGMTGMKINMSLFPKAMLPAGLRKEFNEMSEDRKKRDPRFIDAQLHAGLKWNQKTGEWEDAYAWSTESFPVDEAMAIQQDDRYTKNVGTLVVGLSDAHIWKLLNDPDMRGVIPFHKSNANLREAIRTNVDLHVDYTQHQNDSLADENHQRQEGESWADYYRRIGQAGSAKKTSYGKSVDKNNQNVPNWYECLRKAKDPKKAARMFVEECQKNGIIPRFPEFVYNEDGTFNENYHKVLQDFAGYDKDGNYARQEGVKMTLPEEWREILQEALSKEEKTAAGIRAKVPEIVEQVIQANQEHKNVVADEPQFSQERSKEWKKAADDVKGNREALDILNASGERDIKEVAANVLAGGGLMWGDEGEGQYRKKGVSSMMHWGEGERRKFLGLFTKENGQTLSQVGEAIEQGCRDAGIPYDEDDANAGLNAAMEVLQGARSMGDLRNYVEKKRIREAYDILANDQEREAEERDNWYRQNYGMSYDEYQTYIQLSDQEQTSSQADKDTIDWLKQRNQRQAEQLTQIQKKLDELKVAELGRPLVQAQQRMLQQQKETIDQTKAELNELKDQQRYKKDYSDMYHTLLEVKKQLSQFVREQMAAEDMPFVSKSELNKLLSTIEHTNTVQQMEDAMNSVQQVVSLSHVRHMENRMARLLDMKIQDLNGKRMSVAKTVDDRTRRIIQDIKGRVNDIGISGMEEALDRLYRDRREQRAEINKLKTEQQHAGTEEERIGIQTRIDECEKNWQDLSQQIQAKEKEISDKREEKRKYSTEDIQGEIDTLMKKMDEAAEGRATWTPEDSDKLAALRGFDVIQQTRKQAKDVADINTKISDLWKKVYEMRDDLQNVTDEKQKQHLKDKIEKVKDAIRDQQKLKVEALNAQAESLQNSIDMLEELMDNGRNSLKQKVDADILHRFNILHEAFKEIGGGKAINPNDAEKAEHEPSLLNRATTEPIYGFEYMCKMMGRHGYGTDGWFYRHFIKGKEGVMEAYNTRTTGIREQMDLLNQKVEEIFGTKNGKAFGTDAWIKQAAKADKVVEHSGVSKCQNDEETDRYEIPLTKGQAMYIYMAWKMKDGQLKLHHQGFDETSIQEIKDFIGKDYIALADWIQDEFLPATRAKYNEMYRNLYNTSMANIENYVPLKIAESGRMGDQSDMLGQTQQGTSNKTEEKTGSLITRTVNMLPVDIQQSAFDVISKHIQEQETWYAYSPVRRDLDAILGSRYFQNTLDANNPGNFRRFREAAQIATLSEQQRQMGHMDKIFDSVSKLLTGKNIAWRFATALKQLYSAPAYLGYAENPLYWSILMKDTVTGALGMNWNWCVKNIPSFRDRVDTGDLGDNRLSEINNGNRIMQILNKNQSLGMIPNRLVDGATCSMGIKSIYDYNMILSKRKLKHQTFDTDEEYEQALEEEKRKARMEADIFYNATQQSSHPAFLSDMQKSKGILDKMFTAYQNSNIGYTRMTLDAIHDIVRSAQWKDTFAHSEEMYKNEGYNDKDAHDMAFWHGIQQTGGAATRACIFGVLLKYLWNVGSTAFFGIFGGDNSDKEKQEGETEDEYKQRLYGIWTKDAVSMLATPFQGVPLANMILNLAEGRDISPVLVFNEVVDFIETSGRVAQNYGIYSPQLGYLVLDQTAKMGGVDLETYGNIYLGVEQMIKDAQVENAEDAKKMIDLMYILNNPRKGSADVARNLYKDDSMENYIKKVAMAERYLTYGSAMGQWTPWMKPNTGGRMAKEYDKLQKEWDKRHKEQPAQTELGEQYETRRTNKLYQDNLTWDDISANARLDELAKPWEDAQKKHSELQKEEKGSKAKTKPSKKFVLESDDYARYKMYQTYKDSVNTLKKELDDTENDKNIMQQIRDLREELLKDVNDETKINKIKKNPKKKKKYTYTIGE